MVRVRKLFCFERRCCWLDSETLSSNRKRVKCHSQEEEAEGKLYTCHSIVFVSFDLFSFLTRWILIYLPFSDFISFDFNFNFIYLLHRSCRRSCGSCPWRKIFSLSISSFSLISGKILLSISPFFPFRLHVFIFVSVQLRLSDFCMPTMFSLQTSSCSFIYLLIFP